MSLTRCCLLHARRSIERHRLPALRLRSTAFLGAILLVASCGSSDIPVRSEHKALSGFSYTRPVSVTNSGSSQTNYQVMVTLDTASLIAAGKMRSDCGDLRPADSDGTTLLSYWIESGCNSPVTKLWVKVPS